MSLFQHFPTRYPRCCLSFGIERAILDKINVDELDQETFKQIVLEGYSLVHDEALVSELIDSLMKRVFERIDELNTQEQESKTSGRKSGKTFGSSYAEWLSELDATQSCLYLADYDITKALQLYWNEDYKIVQEAIKLKSNHESQKTLAQLESCMYGFGGKYSDDSGAGNDPNTVNIDDANPDDIQAFMSGFGF